MATFTVSQTTAENPGLGIYDTIQEAIDAAADGDTIVIEPGTYAEAIILDKSLDIQAQPGVTLDGSGIPLSGTSATITLRDGFTGGSIDGFDLVIARPGGNALVSEFGQVIDNVSFTNNTFTGGANTAGPVFYLNPTTTNALIDGNTFQGPNLTSSPLLGLDGGNNITVSNNVFEATPGPYTPIETFPDGNAGNDPDYTFTANTVAGSPDPVAGSDTDVTNEDVGTFNDDVPTATGGVGPYTYALVPGSVDFGTAGGAGADLTLNPDGTYSFTPGADAQALDDDPATNGVVTFQYTATDSFGEESAPATVTISVVGINDAPVGNPDVDTVNEDDSTTGNVLTNDTDADAADTLSAILDTGPTNGTLVLAADGSYTYTPNANFNGADSFTYNVSDGTATSGPITVDITVTPDNDAPVAGDDAYTTDEDVDLVVIAPGVLGNDTDVDMDPLTVSVTDDVDNGTLTLNPDGSFTYNPDQDFNGTDSFTYEVDDGAGGTDTATVTITVDPVDDPYVAVDDGTPAAPFHTIDEDSIAGPFDADDLTALDTNPDGDPVDITSISNLFQDLDGPGGAAPVQVGEVAYNDTTNTYTITPNEDFNTSAGAAYFEYTATSDGVTDTGRVWVGVTSINDAPETGGPATASGTEDAPIIDSLPPADDSHNGAPDENNAITYQLSGGGFEVNGNPAGAGDGTVVVGPGAGFSYTPGANQQALDVGESQVITFQYVATDGDPSAPATVTVTVNGVNDAPVAVNDPAVGSYAATEGQVLPADASRNLIANDTDVDGETLSAVAETVTSTQGGSVTIFSNGTFTYTPPGGVGGNFTGSDSFTYTVRDPDGATDDGTASITVGDTADAPVADNETGTTNEDPPARTTTFEGDVVNLTPANGYYSEAFLLTGDTDPDPGAVLNVTSVGSPQNGTVELRDINGTTYAVFTPDANYSGPAQFDYAVTDEDGNSDIGRVFVTVAERADGPPVAGNDTIVVTEQVGRIVTADELLGNDTDPDNAGAGAGTDQLFIRAITNISANASITDIQTDGNGNITSFRLTTTSDAAGQDASFDYVVDDSAARPASAADPRVPGVPDTRTGTDIGTVTVDVTNVEDDPVANGETVGTTFEDDTNGITFDADDLLANDTDLDNVGNTNAGLTTVIPVGAVNGGTIVDNGDGTFTFIPDDDVNNLNTAPIGFTYTVSDPEGNTDTAFATFSITEVNDAPIAGDDAPTFQEDPNLSLMDTPLIAEDRDTVFTGVLTGYNPAIGAVSPGMVADTDGDPEVQNLTIVGATSAFGTIVSFSDANGGTIVFRPNTGFQGDAAITYTVQDNGTTNGVADPEQDTGTISFHVVDSVTLSGTDDDYSAVLAGADDSVRIQGLGGDDNISGTDFVDEIDGGAGNDTISGLGGNDRLTGGADDDTVFGNDGNDNLYMHHGGVETTSGGAGMDGIWYGSTMTGADTNSGGADIDTLALGGTYGTASPLGLYVMTSQNMSGDIETLYLASGQTVMFPGQTGGQFHDYNIAMRDANVAAGGILTVLASDLVAGEDLWLDASDERSGSYRVFMGGGNDRVITGEGTDGVFAEAGDYTGAEIVDLRGGINDTFGLRGNFTETLNFVTNAEVLAFFSGQVPVPGVPSGVPGVDFDYNITLVDANGTAGTVLTISAVTLTTGENFTLNASAEDDANLTIFGGGDDDVITGGINPGFTDYIFGGLGGDQMNGGNGNVVGGDGRDVYLYTNANQSGGSQANIDVLGNFDFGQDRLDVSEGGEVVNGFTGARGIPDVEVVDVSAIFGGQLDNTPTGSLTSDEVFFRDLAAALDGELSVGVTDSDGNLNVDSAFLQATSGAYAGFTALVVDTNGNGSVDTGDLVVLFDNLNPVVQLPPTVDGIFL